MATRTAEVSGLPTALARREQLARAPRLVRLARHPGRELRFRARWRLQGMLQPEEVVADLFSGQRLRVVLPEKVGIEIYRNGFYEAALTHFVLDTLRPGMTFVDVGAQYGYHSMVASLLVGSNGAVYSFEPSRRTFQLLEANTQALANVHREQLAVFSKPGTARIRDFGPSHSALNTLTAHARVPAGHEPDSSLDYEVPCVTLDDFFASESRQPDFVKVDAESVELEVLRGMDRLLRERDLILSVETGDYTGEDSVSAACIAYLGERGYRCFEYVDGRLVAHQPRARYEYDNLYFKKG